ncbi:AAA family ATPase [Nocardioides marmoriginsengisoli]|uniref:AAA family ATPase n=1 Tax=Nocardioides marmoriginsengisoli TaxID=661483 RepID=A0A3N0CB42_9ACTN|nr:AAA family ATPase [Nocardioides marmoriginsengisoli]RNL60529.1 AAA family ATPase [Nocardioides marmoriginsengisoli]
MRLQEHVAAREASVFVAREGELGRLRTFLENTSEHRVVFLTGPAGSGKSALLRELARRAPSLGYTVVELDARELLADTGRLEEAFADAAVLARPLILLDSAELLGLHQALLREQHLGRLPVAARVVVAQRDEVEPAWWTSPWAPSLLVLPIGPLESGAVAAFLAARGVRDPDEVARVTSWADGHALSLTLATAARESSGRALTDADLGSLEHRLLDHLTAGRLADPDLVHRDRTVLMVAALAPSVDAGLLAAVLPDIDGDRAERWLRALPFAERLGGRVTLHQRIRRLIAAQLRRIDPDLERSLRLRIIDHLIDAADRAHLAIDLREVLAPPQDRGVTPSRALASPWKVEQATASDLAFLQVLLADRDPSYLAWVLRWVREAPEHTVVVRRPGTGEPVAFTVWATPESVPAGFADDRLLRGWLDWATEHDLAGQSLLNPVTELWVTEDVADEVRALVLTALVQACGLPNFKRWVVTRNPPAPDPLHCGGIRARELDLAFGDLRFETYVLDYGDAGVIPAIRHQAHVDLAATRTPVSGTAAETVQVEAVREALRSFHDPLVLAASPLARGTDPAGRAEYLTRLIRTAVDEAFGDHDDARLHRDVLLLGYLEAGAGHARAMRALHMSRTTYFRRLRDATARLAAWLAAAS